MSASFDAGDGLDANIENTRQFRVTFTRKAADALEKMCKAAGFDAGEYGVQLRMLETTFERLVAAVNKPIGTDMNSAIVAQFRDACLCLDNLVENTGGSIEWRGRYQNPRPIDPKLIQKLKVERNNRFDRPTKVITQKVVEIREPEPPAPETRVVTTSYKTEYPGGYGYPPYPQQYPGYVGAYPQQYPYTPTYPPANQYPSAYPSAYPQQYPSAYPPTQQYPSAYPPTQYPLTQYPPTQQYPQYPAANPQQNYAQYPQYYQQPAPTTPPTQHAYQPYQGRDAPNPYTAAYP
jgi:hypothetical protein